MGDVINLSTKPKTRQQMAAGIDDVVRYLAENRDKIDSFLVIATTDKGADTSMWTGPDVTNACFLTDFAKAVIANHMSAQFGLYAN